MPKPPAAGQFLQFLEDILNVFRAIRKYAKLLRFEKV